MTCPHCGGEVKTPLERWRASRRRRGWCLFCPRRSDGHVACAVCREKKNARRRVNKASAA